MVNGSSCNVFALAFLRTSFSLLHRADETKPGRNSCPRLQPYLIGSCRVDVLQSRLFYVVRSALAVYCMFVHFLAD